jgi:UDP-2,3-diacylglucosamine hydrolase
VSDVHLTASDPGGIRRFLAFLAGPAERCARLVVVGDLFDVWVTPSQASDPALVPVFAALRGLASRIDVGFVEGNRDFAASPELAAAGVRRLPDVEVIEHGGRRVVVTHGDLLCTKDVRYQAYRRIARTATVRHLLRRAPASAAERIGGAARKGSAMETSAKAYGDMGLAPAAVASILRVHDADALVCGHVHWGQRFRIDVDGRDRDVVVLGAWETAPTYAVLSDEGLSFRRFE